MVFYSALTLVPTHAPDVATLTPFLPKGPKPLVAGQVIPLRGQELVHLLHLLVLKVDTYVDCCAIINLYQLGVTSRPTEDVV